MYRGLPNIKKYLQVVTAFAVTTFVISCKAEAVTESVDTTLKPVQTVKGMKAEQTLNGVLQMRMESPLLQRFVTEEESYELFSQGFDVYAYNEAGEVETRISSQIAKHTTKKNDEETWEAYGNVVITNYIKGERMETDTLYWDRNLGKIHTHCHVKMYSPSGFMQGYGMESDEMARNAYILRPFDSYGVVGSNTNE